MRCTVELSVTGCCSALCVDVFHPSLMMTHHWITANGSHHYSHLSSVSVLLSLPLSGSCHYNEKIIY